jgi:hypothetical protein
VRFVALRNRVAHGNIGGLAEFAGSLVEYLPDAEAEARWQVDVAKRFVVDWFNTSPDVQGGAIHNHRWPA